MPKCLFLYTRITSGLSQLAYYRQSEFPRFRFHGPPVPFGLPYDSQGHLSGDVVYMRLQLVEGLSQGEKVAFCAELAGNARWLP